MRSAMNDQPILPKSQGRIESRKGREGKKSTKPYANINMLTLQSCFTWLHWWYLHLWLDAVCHIHTQPPRFILPLDLFYVLEDWFQTASHKFTCLLASSFGFIQRASRAGDQMLGRWRGQGIVPLSLTSAQFWQLWHSMAAASSFYWETPFLNLHFSLRVQ